MRATRAKQWGKVGGEVMLARRYALALGAPKFSDLNYLGRA